jgi:hypothetical protein
MQRHSSFLKSREINKNVNLECAAENPVEYLAALGIFTLCHQLDPCVEARWNEEGLELKTACAEQKLLNYILPVVTDFTRWNFIKGVPSGKDKDVYRAVVTLDPPFHLDWWYDSVAALQRECIFEFSDWKLFAGNQSLTRTVEALIAATPKISSLQDLISAQVSVTGRFGFDPLASQNALDAGYSPNNLNIPVPTSVPAELLSLFAIQVFFPPRCGANARGWSSAVKKGDRAGFSYATWDDFLPLTLARIAAVRDKNRMLFSERKMRKHYGSLSPAQEKI